MCITKYKPPPQLSHIIHEYAIVRLLQGFPAEKCIPNGFVKLFLYLDNKPIYKDAAGKLIDWADGFGGHPVDDDFYILAPSGIDAIMCTFTPAGVALLYNTPLRYMNNNILPADALLGNSLPLLKEQLSEAKDDKGIVAVLNRYFIKLLLQQKKQVHNSPVFYAQDILIACQGMANIDELAVKLNITRRSLERNFIKQVGMAPKYFARIVRINYAFAQKQNNPTYGWQDILHRCGFFDQSHFIKEFKHFTGVVPQLYYKNESPVMEAYVGKAIEED